MGPLGFAALLVPSFLRSSPTPSYLWTSLSESYRRLQLSRSVGHCTIQLQRPFADEGSCLRVLQVADRSGQTSACRIFFILTFYPPEARSPPSSSGGTPPIIRFRIRGFRRWLRGKDTNKFLGHPPSLTLHPFHSYHLSAGTGVFLSALDFQRSNQFGATYIVVATCF